MSYRLAGIIFFMLMGWEIQAQFFPPVQQKTAATGIGLYREVGYPGSYLLSIAHSREYQLRTWFTLGAEGVLYRFTKGPYSSVGATIRPVTRLFVDATPQLQLFAEAKGGVIFMLPEYPHRLVNYVFVGSLGATWQYSKYNELRLSCGYNHLSNGKRKGDAINPTWDGIGAELMYVHKLH